MKKSIVVVALVMSAAVGFGAGWLAGRHAAWPVLAVQARTTMATGTAEWTWSYADDDGWAVWQACETNEEAEGMAAHFGGSVSRMRAD